MATPLISDFPLYTGREINNIYWDLLIQQTVNLVTSNYDVTFGAIVADTLVADISGCTGFPSTDLSLIAGEDIAAGKVVRQASGQFYLATNASDAGVTNIYGIATTTATAGNSVSATRGVITNQSGLTANTTYYLSTSGGITSSKPSTRPIPLGYAISSTNFLYTWPFTESSVTMSSLNIKGPFSVNSSTLYVDNTNSVVGIGTSSPISTANLTLSIGQNEDTCTWGSHTTTGSYTADIGQYFKTANTRSGSVYKSSGSIHLDFNTSFSLNIGTCQVDSNYDTYTPYLSINGTSIYGSLPIGIGQTSPQGKLDVVGSSSAGVSQFISNTNTAGYTALYLTETSSGGASPGYLARYNSTNGQANVVELGSSGGIYLNASTDVYSEALTSYATFLSSHNTGFSSITSAYMNIKRIGKTAFIWFELEGISNATTLTFDIPYTFSASIGGAVAAATNNGTSYGFAGLAFSGSTVACHWNNSPGTWANVNSKSVKGTLIIQTS